MNEGIQGATSRLRPVHGGAFATRGPDFWKTHPFLVVLHRCEIDGFLVFVHGPALSRALAQRKARLTATLSEQDVKTLLRNEFERAGKLSQTAAVNLVQSQDAKWKRDVIREKLAEITGGAKQGPKGPRTPKPRGYQIQERGWRARSQGANRAKDARERRGKYARNFFARICVFRQFQALLPRSERGRR